MPDIISSLSPTVQIVVICGVLFICMQVITLAAKYGINLKRGNFSFSFGRSKKETDESPHKFCNNKHDVLESMKRVREIERDIMELKWIKSIKRQMDYVESSTKQAINKLLRIYTSMLKEKGKSNPIKTESCQSYLLVLKILEARLVDRSREYMRENHLTDKTDQEFESYIESRSNALRLLTTETLNDLYHYDKDITRAKLYDANDSQFHEMEHIMRECFVNCRVVALDIDKAVEALESEINSIFERFLS